MILEILDPLEDLELIVVEFAYFWKFFFPEKASAGLCFLPVWALSVLGCFGFFSSLLLDFSYWTQSWRFLTIPLSLVASNSAWARRFPACNPAALFRPELSVFTELLRIHPTVRAFLSSEFRPRFALKDCSNWPALIWSGLKEFRPCCNCRKNQNFRRLLLKFSLSLLGCFPRFHLWINP